jgi:hypothetical protein
LFTHLRFGLPSGHFPSGFPNNTIYAYSSPIVLHALPIASIWLHHSNYTWRKV